MKRKGTFAPLYSKALSRMDHAEATDLQAVEKYLLDELSSSEKESFEEHFFTCAQCAEDVRAGAVLRDNLRAVARDAAHLPSENAERAGWGARLGAMIAGPALIPSLAAAAFCAIAIIESAVIIPGLRTDLARYREPRAIPSFALRAAARGDEGAILVPRTARSFTVYFDITWNKQPGGYVCQVLDASKQQRAEVKIPGQERGETINLLLDTSRFPPGRYAVLVRSLSSPSEELGRYEFTLDYR